jgi:hypothetical protein
MVIGPEIKNADPVKTRASVQHSNLIEQYQNIIRSEANISDDQILYHPPFKLEIVWKTIPTCQEMYGTVEEPMPW